MNRSELRSILPPLSADEQQHSSALERRLREAVTAAGGWLSFERFMELALYAPGLGYYSAGSSKLGASGDFVTAPEVSDLFSRCVARQCADVLSATGGGILELGAGTGRMAADVLLALDALGVLPDRYAILEVSADLAERQRALLNGLPVRLRERVAWLERLPEKPLRGVVLANEVLDALPCRRFVIAGDAAAGADTGVDAAAGGAAAFGAGDAGAGGARGILELGVALQGELFAARTTTLEGASFVDCAATPDSSLAAACAALLDELPQPLPSGYTSEICLRVEPWIASLAECLERGLILLFDYGLPRSHYYHPQRVNGTLQCHFKHLAHDNPYVNVGVQDITAWVDFTRVAEAAVAAGLEVNGFCTQAAFLLATGIERLVSESSGIVEQTRRAGEARRLLMPGEMGEAFKVMALTRAHDTALAGFSLQDLRHSL
ncbi:MAG TPA: SAM-dependent methyltransferase [Steroidobacteraceae bacterium]|nr:SAM-dependent methyltransferase [Steroidobacteraceae bacterium]